MSEQSIVDPSKLRSRVNDYDTLVAAPLNRAVTLLNGAPRAVAFPSFSTVGFALATAYVEALNFTFADLDSKTNLISEFADRLASTATTWETTEEANTVETQG